MENRQEQEIFLEHIWAKFDPTIAQNWHPLFLHMLDVSACADEIMEREPEPSRINLADCLGLEWNLARPWLLFLIASHDIGKACPGFQSKWQDGPDTGLSYGIYPNSDVQHGFVSQIALSDWLMAVGWPTELASMAADAVGCHHGSRATPSALQKLEGDRRAIGSTEWVIARSQFLEQVCAVFGPTINPVKERLSGSNFMLLAGLTSFADWIGSNTKYFPFGTVEDCYDLPSWYNKRRARAREALDSIGWTKRTPLMSEPKSFETVFQMPPRPLQKSVEKLLPDVSEPVLLLVEAPMGEGKTEAAFYAFLELQRKFHHRGLYVALPTKATGNAMFARTLSFLRSQGGTRNLDLQLVHGGTWLNETFTTLRMVGIYDSESGAEVRASEWFTSRKRALLSEYGVGTVDQAILPVLPVRHNFVRLWGLSNRVVVFDEIHAYDQYTGSLLLHSIRWLLALGSSVILLSATLPPSLRRKLAEVAGATLTDSETPYPRLTSFRAGRVDTRSFFADVSRRQIVKIKPASDNLAVLRDLLSTEINEGGMGLALLNTVQRAQELYKGFADGKPIFDGEEPIGKQLADGTEIFLFHARYPAEQRQKRENNAIATFGKEGSRKGKKILIATQVVEQSLDLDFDIILTDLAPMDLLLQRAGRLWRHRRLTRPIAEPVLYVSGLDGDVPVSFAKPLYWDVVYREDFLIATWLVLKSKQTITLPDDIEALVSSVYEDRISIPSILQDRYEGARTREQGEALAETWQANRAIVGFPDDDSWDDAARFALYDEDSPGVHKMLIAQTRLSDESIEIIPLRADAKFDAGVSPSNFLVSTWVRRALNVSAKHVVKRLKQLGVPKGWKDIPLLRRSYALLLDDEGRWIEDPSVQLDADLGLVYQSKSTDVTIQLS